MGLCIKELDRIYGIRDGSQNKKGDNRIGETNNFTDQSPKTEEELLKSLGLGVTRQTIQNYKKLTDIIPELEDLMDTGVVKSKLMMLVSNCGQSNTDDSSVYICYLCSTELVQFERLIIRKKEHRTVASICFKIRIHHPAKECIFVSLDMISLGSPIIPGEEY
jgi:hypothetical protein